MSTHYRKISTARIDRVGDDFVLLRDDHPAAFTMSDSGAVLWEALDYFSRASDLELLLAEARTDLPRESVRLEVRAFLERLVEHGLVSPPTRQVRKQADIVTELVGSELIVLSRSNRKVHLLNESGALLWEALDHFGEGPALESLVAEAWPEKSETEVAAVVEEFLSGLLSLGLVEEVT